MALLRSLDMFSGIGGITHGLRGLCEPVAYCEIDEACRTILRKLMDKGAIPRAPLLGDVSSVTAEDVGGSNVDIILAGFPCPGFSAIGKRAGFEHPGSGLFAHIVRLVDVFDPPFVFLENVPPILSRESGGCQHVCESLGARGYSARWMILPAFAVNGAAPHERKRWFCLCWKPPVHAALQNDVSEVHEHASPEPVQRMVIETATGHPRRLEQLGNTVVPDVVRAAFCTMWSNMPDCRVAGFVPGPRPFRAPEAAVGAKEFDTSKPWPPFGMFSGDHRKFLATAVPSFFRETRDWDIRLDPAMFQGTPRNPVTSSLLTSVIHRRAWSTPRRASGRASNVLTARSCKDLPTQLRYAVDTPDELRQGCLNPDWLEWLMGFPTGWTSFAKNVDQ